MKKYNINKFSFFIYNFSNLFYAIIRKIVGRKKFKRNKYNGNKLINITDANDIIYNAILDNKPFLACRFGDLELRTTVYAIRNIVTKRVSFPKYVKEKMPLNAGFFPPTNEMLQSFGELMLTSCAEANLYGVWYNYLEDYVIKTFSPKANLTVLEYLEPYRCEFPWSAALKGKKVLVVHPFSETIEKQYLNREKIFKNPNVLPDFDLITYKAVQSNAGAECDFSNWFDALEKMYDDIKKIDFDVAIVGCGAYGLPLSAKIKKLNKVVIHLAGATQMLFGIRGKRWDVRPEMQYLFNEFWVRPSSNEKPKGADKVENGCYW